MRWKAEMTNDSVGIVGGGIVGLAVAREILRRRPGTRVVVLEQEDAVARHQTGHSSGVAHAGIYYQPGSLKAELCTRGRVLLRDYCAEHALPYDECGKLVVAVDETELPRLDALERTATANRVPGLTRLEASGILDVEPHAAGLAALHSPRTAITDYAAVCRSLAAEIAAAGGEVRLSTRVTGIARRLDAVEVVAGAESLRVDSLVLCGGLQSDRLGQLAGGAPSPRIVPFKGEYLQVSAAKQDLVRGMVYPVPDPQYPFLGVHYTRRVDGRLEVGPNAFVALSRRHYGRFAATPGDVAATVAAPAFWRFARRNWRAGLAEVPGIVSTKAYMRAARRYVPAIGPDDVVRSGLGLRAQALDSSGALVDDFVIEHLGRITSVRNAPSPAATSSLAIAEHVIDRMDRTVS